MNSPTNTNVPGHTRSEVTGSTAGWNRDKIPTLRNGTVTFAARSPILREASNDQERQLNADSQSPGDHSPLDLRGLRIGLLSSSTDIADAAEALITRRYQFAPV